MSTLSFRLPKSAVKELQKRVEYTKWVQALVLKNLGICPHCSQRLPGSSVEGHDTGFESSRLKEVIERASRPETSETASQSEPAGGLKLEPGLPVSPPKRKLPSLDELIEKCESVPEPLEEPSPNQTNLIDWLAEQARTHESA